MSHVQTVQIKDVLQKTTLFFKDKGFTSARLDTELLIADALKWERVKLYLNYEYPLSPEELANCREAVRRRATGEPVAYILGRKDFYNHSFVVNSAVLIPRPETEQIVEDSASWLRANADIHNVRLLDLGTGSGCIGLSLLAELAAISTKAAVDANTDVPINPVPLQSRLLGVDISESAVEVAKLNAANLNLSESAKFLCRDVQLLRADEVLNVLGGRADVVVANPPYISPTDPAVENDVRRFEPALALFSDADGLSHIRLWAKQAGDLLRPGGFVMFEIGHEQGAAALEIFSILGFYEDVRIVKDLSGRDRFIRATHKTSVEGDTFHG